MHFSRWERGLVGLALSGGGVRSAAFCLGTIQALARWGVFQKVDYLSTVSGGGFIGSCLSSMYSQGTPEFPFLHDRGVPENAPMRHLRNYSNYLGLRLDASPSGTQPGDSEKRLAGNAESQKLDCFQ